MQFSVWYEECVKIVSPKLLEYHSDISETYIKLKRKYLFMADDYRIIKTV